jgi:hypothetical protein
MYVPAPAPVVAERSLLSSMSDPIISCYKHFDRKDRIQTTMTIPLQGQVLTRVIFIFLGEDIANKVILVLILSGISPTRVVMKIVGVVVVTIHKVAIYM